AAPSSSGCSTEYFADLKLSTSHARSAMRASSRAITSASTSRYWPTITSRRTVARSRRARVVRPSVSSARSNSSSLSARQMSPTTIDEETAAPAARVGAGVSVGGRDVAVQGGPAAAGVGVVDDNGVDERRGRRRRGRAGGLRQHAAGSLELLHAAALIHDDVIDNSDT